MYTAVLIGSDPATPPPPHPGFGLINGALLVSQDRRHLFVTPLLYTFPFGSVINMSRLIKWAILDSYYGVSFHWLLVQTRAYYPHWDPNSPSTHLRPRCLLLSPDALLSSIFSTRYLLSRNGGGGGRVEYFTRCVRCNSPGKGVNLVGGGLVLALLEIAIENLRHFFSQCSVVWNCSEGPDTSFCTR